jgi:hypothetical protein
MPFSRLVDIFSGGLADRGRMNGDGITKASTARLPHEIDDVGVRITK